MITNIKNIMEIARSRLWILRMNKYEGENAGTPGKRENYCRMREEKCESELAGKILKKQPIWREIKGPKSDEQITITR